MKNHLTMIYDIAKKPDEIKKKGTAILANHC